MPGMSIHVVDVSRGVAARGMRNEVLRVAPETRTQSVPLPAEPFLDVACHAFGIDDVAQHYHLPMKTTPWGYSCFRGGA